MTKRAGIYVRTSSERQGEKVSPQAQEDDSRAYCESKGYLVVDVYKDIKRYRSKGKIVEPSGTRHDRPEFNRMLKDSDKGVFDVLIAWREDRLYRGVNRAMLEINELVTQKVISVELVKEHYDPTVAAVKAWAAGIELQAKRDRMSMGVAARLSKGKPWNQASPYGYSKDADGYYVINPEEAEWIERLFEWFAESVPVLEIRRRLIEGGAKQRNKIKWPWSPAILYRYLSAEHYWIGYFQTKWDGVTYKIPIEPIIGPEIAERAAQRRSNYKKYPAGNSRHHSIAAGLIRCDGCGNRLSIVSYFSNHVRKDGTRKKWVYYICQKENRGFGKENCVRRITVSGLDEKIWAKVWKLISEPGEFEAAMQRRIAELQAEEVDAKAESRKLERQLDDISLERQKVITFARKDMITEEDLETQLLSLEFAENKLRRDLDSYSLLLGNRADRLQNLAQSFRDQVKTGLEGINSEPDSPEREKQQLEYRRKIVHSIVKKVEVRRDKSVSIEAVISLPEVADINLPSPLCRSSSISSIDSR